MDKNIIALGNNETEKQISVPQKSSGTFDPVRYSGFGIQFRYSVRTVPLDFKDFKDIYKHKSIKTKRKILPKPIIFTTNKALTYPQMLVKRPKMQ